MVYEICFYRDFCPKQSENDAGLYYVQAKSTVFHGLVLFSLFLLPKMPYGVWNILERWTPE